MDFVMKQALGGESSQSVQLDIVWATSQDHFQAGALPAPHPFTFLFLLVPLVSTHFLILQSHFFLCSGSSPPSILPFFTPSIGSFI